MWLVLALLVPGRVDADTRVLDGLAIVQADGSLRVSGETVFLYGVYLPRLERTCTTSSDHPAAARPRSWC